MQKRKSGNSKYQLMQFGMAIQKDAARDRHPTASSKERTAFASYWNSSYGYKNTPRTGK
ncbi:MAG: hypothetical protein OIF50_11390 [Flavobacteriaceae bacterium]|nr:hypothetical protein [Flavobacteriaceae bacterium]